MAKGDAHDKARLKFYVVNKGVYTYSSYGREWGIKKLPSKLSLAFSETPIALAHYSGGGRGKFGGITVYMDSPDESTLKIISKKKHAPMDIRDPHELNITQTEMFKEERIDVEKALRDYNIRIEILDSIPEELRERIIYNICHDVHKHVIGPGKPKDVKHITLVDKIEEIFKIKERKAAKHDVTKLGKGANKDNCILDIGYDFSEGCPAGFTPKGETVLEFLCRYCYALFNNSLDFHKTLFKFTKDDLKEYTLRYARIIVLNEMIRGQTHSTGRDYDVPTTIEDHVDWMSNKFKWNRKKTFFPDRWKTILNSDQYRETMQYIEGLLRDGQPITIRFGQNTDVMYPKKMLDFGFENKLHLALDTLKEMRDDYNIRGVLVTKMPEYSKKTVKKLKDANTALLISIFRQELEKGVVAWGFNSKKRIVSGDKYADAAVPTGYYMAMMVNYDQSHIPKDVQMALDHLEKSTNPNLFGQILDFRPTTRETAMQTTGYDWDMLKSHTATWLPPLIHTDDFGHRTEVNPYLWSQTGQHNLTANFVHPDIQKLIGDNRGKIRGCISHLGENNYCGLCLTDRLK